MTETRHDRDRGSAGIPSHWKAVLIIALWLMLVGPASKAVFIPVNLVGVMTTVNPSEAKSIEYQLKAAFLYNFMKFVEWPDTKTAGQANSKTPVTLCVIGTDYFGKHLDDLTKKEVKERPIRIVRIEGFESYQKSHPGTTRQGYLDEQKKVIEACYLLFISQSEESLMYELITSLETTQVLTVSDISSFVDSGGVIQFVMEENKIRFDVNVVSAEKKGLKISSQLLQLARKVRKKS